MNKAMKRASLFLITAVMIAALGCGGCSRGSSGGGGSGSGSSQEQAGGTITMTTEADEIVLSPSGSGGVNDRAVESFQSGPISMPPQTYVGRWGDADNYLHILIIYDEVGEREINFFWHISGRISTRATALIQDNRIVFDVHDDTGHMDDYVYYAVRGTMVFDENGILLTIERSDNPMIRAGETFRYTGTIFIHINGGTFTMGSSANEPGRGGNETQRQVTVSEFFMGRYPVTQAEYEQVMGTNTSEFRGPDLPVGNVSWFDAVEYCNRRSEMEGLIPAYTITGSGWERSVTWNRYANGYRLPTEAEWEYACRAGTTTPFNTGNNITTDQANYDGNYPYNNNNRGQYRAITTPVGSFAANSWGLYDMHGNVWEWCWDWYGAYPSGAETDPEGPASGADRVFRGGSWSDHGQHMRSAFRQSLNPSGYGSGTGFRLVRSGI